MINRMSRGLHGETSCLGKGSVCSRGLLTSVSLIVDLITPTPRLGFRNKHESLETKKKELFHFTTLTALMKYVRVMFTIDSDYTGSPTTKTAAPQIIYKQRYEFC